LRLAVKLNLDVQQLPGAKPPVSEAWHNDKYCRVPWGNNPLDATMEAIFLAAVEIGRSMRNE